jgi:hypothetical protein
MPPANARHTSSLTATRLGRSGPAACDKIHVDRDPCILAKK